MRKCLLCGASLIDTPLLSFEDMPLSAQNILDENELHDECGMELKLFQCKGCGLVQFDCEPVDYYRDVIRSGGYSSTMVNLRKAQYEHLIEKYNLQNKNFIEIGCGQGEFLNVLSEYQVNVFGIEHRKELVDIAQKNGLNVWQDFVENDDTKLANGPFDVFLSFNFLEHQPNPNEMLRGIYNNLTEDGMGLITVPSFEYILENDGYYEFIRDHLVYYTFDTLKFALEKNGFEVLEKEMVNRDTISMIVRKRPRIDAMRLKESYDLICGEVNQYLDKLHCDGKTTALWGASHQGFTLASTAKLQGKAEYIIDSAPFKQGKYAPASHIPIISPDEAVKRPVDAIIIVAPGYTDEIAGIIKERFGENIEIMTLMSNHLKKYGD